MIKLIWMDYLVFLNVEIIIQQIIYKAYGVNILIKLSLLLVFSIFILNACAGNTTKEKAICTTDGAYATGYNDGTANDDMIPNFAISKCSSLHLNQLATNSTELNSLDTC